MRLTGSADSWLCGDAVTATKARLFVFDWRVVTDCRWSPWLLYGMILGLIGPRFGLQHPLGIQGRELLLNGGSILSEGRLNEPGAFGSGVHRR